MSRFASLVGGELGRVDWRAETAKGNQPSFEFAYLESQGFAAIGSDTRLRAGKLCTNFRAVRHRRVNQVLACRAALQYTGRGGAIYCISEEIGIPLTTLAVATGWSGRVVVGIHGHHFHTRHFRGWIAIARRMDWIRFGCLSESIAARLRAFGVPSDRISTYGVPVDTDFFQPGDAPEDNRLVASAGAAMRDYDTLLEAAGPLDVRVSIANDSTWTSEQTVEGNLPSNVTMRSFGNYVNLRALYAEAALVVVPLYQTEHAAGYAVMVEAMAMGKPVIATRTKAPGDFVLEGKTGLLVEPGDAEGLRQAVASLVADPERRRAMGREARRLVQERYSLPAFGRSLTRSLG